MQTAKTTGGPAGTVIMTGPMRVSILSQEPDDVVTFVEEFVALRPSDVAKLGRAGTAERHLFIWSGVFSTGWVPLRALELDVPQLPHRAPQLPEELTHVWVAPEATPPARIVVWSATTDWVQVGTIGRPAEGDLAQEAPPRERKNRTISADASGPDGSVYEPTGLPPNQP